MTVSAGVFGKNGGIKTEQQEMKVPVNRSMKRIFIVTVICLQDEQEQRVHLTKSTSLPRESPHGNLREASICWIIREQNKPDEYSGGHYDKWGRDFFPVTKQKKPRENGGEA